MFGGRKAGPSGLESASFPAAADTSMIDPRRAGKTKSDDRDGDGGHCATCDAKVRWPKAATEFRCPTCLMINDIKVPTRSRALSRDHGNSSAPRSGTSPAQPQDTAKALPVTAERTLAILNRCIDTYLETRKATSSSYKLGYSGSPPVSPNQRHQQSSPMRSLPITEPSALTEDWPTTPPQERDYPQPMTFGDSPRLPPLPREDHESNRRPSFGHAIPRKPLPKTADSLPVRSARSAAPSHLPLPLSAPTSRPKPGFHSVREPTTSPRDERQAPQFIPASKIFKPLENFLARSYGDQESLNVSFFTSQARSRPHARSLDGSKSHRPRSPPKQPRPADGQIQEIDAKSLLIGDFAENGTWWAGHGERSMSSSAKRPKPERGKPERGHEKAAERPETRISSKSPLISWGEVEDWYDSVLKAGISWRERARKLELEQSLDSEEIEDALAEGRAHLHRAILKITEALLKRPGRPLKESSDVRFLLLLLANPLLYPHGQAPRSFDQFQDGTSTQEPSTAFTAEKRYVDSAWDHGNAYGIIKRILGLVSNLPGDCHRHLTSWFARYDESRFRSYVDLVQRFLTHRLKRQHGRKRSNHVNPVEGLIPSLSGTSADTSAQLHAALGLSNSKAAAEAKNQYSSYSEDWQVRAAAKFMAMLFSANKVFYGQRSATTLAADAQMTKRGSISRTHMKNHGQLLSTTDFYNSMVDLSDPIADFDTWESSKSRFAFCQYPFFLSVGTKIRLIQHDAKRQMNIKAREAFFDSLLKNKALEQYLILKVRRDCLVEDSLNGISEVVASTQEDIKKGLRVQFVGEEGIDAGGLRKEWFLLLMREIFNPDHGLFLYDDESPFCYFNPNTFETSDRYYLVGAVLGLAIYNSTILDVALPPFLFKKLLNLAASQATTGRAPHARSAISYTLRDLAEYKPALARGLRQLLEFDGDVRETFQRDFVIEVERYDSVVEMPLCDNGANRAVTNSNRAEFVELYIRYILDTQVARQFEPFKRGFFTVCGGNALSLFQPEEIELLVRGSDEPLDVPSLRAVAVYDNWKDPTSGRPIPEPAERVPLLVWFWELFEAAPPADQRRVLSFITGSDRIPAVGATSLVIKVAFGGPDRHRLPIARTCFNLLLLYDYRSKRDMSQKLWMAVLGSEGFGLK